MRKVTRSTRWYWSPSMRRGDERRGSAMIRLRQAKMLLLAVAEAEDRLAEDADDVDRRVADADRPADGVAGREEDAPRPRVPRIATGAADVEVVLP